MESLALSLLLIPALAALVSCLAAAEQLADDSVGIDGNAAENMPGKLVRRVGRELLELGHTLADFAGFTQRLRRLGCLIGLLSPILAFAVIPIAPPLAFAESAVMIAADIDVAVLFLIATLSLSTFGQILADDNRQAARLTGSLVVLAAVGLASLGVIRLTGTWRLDEMIVAQERLGIWWLAQQPLGFAGMLLSLVWLIFGVTAPGRGMGIPTEKPPAEKPLADEPQRGFVQSRIMLYLQLIVLAYLLVALFLGGWHVWGIDAGLTPGDLGWLGWTIQFAALHLKVICLLGWLVWLRFIRLPETVITAWRGRIGVAALIASALNLIVTEFSEQYLASRPDVWKAGLAWGALMFALAMIATFAKQVSPD